ncbi:ribosome-associated translation inhibitor RaiA [Lentisphaera profundi]|uniref:Ribosome hibernation promoting factor n=1 Tax=Lentisphaera profundi TaxID=1658616 RepID=A0ABY7VYT5_9BACT|nr:ribosome-associated translation inhibitor RaiA [Lentisphaera profundi]WDE98429.1 ribosome-associated translation inhibitor RaiA [Lentisphaera profundi]
MDIIVSGKNLQLTEALKDSVESHLSNMRVSYPKLNKAEVVLSHGHGKYKVEIVLHGNKINIDAHAETDDMYKSIADAVDRLDRQLEKKLETFHHNHKGEHLGDIERRHEEEVLENIDEY